jgi:hypothetical protein
MAQSPHLVRHSLDGGRIMYTNPRYANELGGILLQQPDGVDLYVDSGELHAAAVAGVYGPVAEYIAPDPEPAPIPSFVTMRQARRALLNAGLMGSINAAIDALPSPQKEAVIIDWEYSQKVQRNHQFVQLLAAEIGLTNEQLNNLFIEAAQI